MAETMLKQQLFDKVVTRFQGILKSSGYKSDLGLHVFPWRATPYGEDELPALAVRDPKVETTVVEGHRHMMTIEVEITTSGSTSAYDMRLMIADLHKAIGTDIFWGNLALNTHPGQEEMQIEQHDQTIGGAKITFFIEFRTVEWNPYQRL